jgi:exopolysaccharide biosynthesis polyprenyl glycosylphosphotransferase
LLILSETLLLTLVVGLWTTAHLWDPSERTRELLNNAIPALSVEDALFRCMTSAFLLAVLSQIAIAFNELYDVRISGSRYDRAGKFVESAGSALGLTLLAVVLAKWWGLKEILDFPPLSLGMRVQTIVFAMLTSFALLYYWRTLFHWLLRRVEFGERVLILGGGRTAKELGREILERPDAGFVLVGILPDAQHREGGGDATQRLRHAWSEAGKRAERRDGGPAPALVGGATVLAPQAALGATTVDKLSPTAQSEVELRMQLLVLEPLGVPDANENETAPRPKSMLELVQSKDADLVVVAMENRRNSVPIDDLLECRLAGIGVREYESVYEQITGKIAVEALRPSYLIFNEGFTRHPWNALAKRGVDFVFSILMLALTWPLMIATAIFVRFDSPGPILFTQERVGRDGKPFTLFKFRSMRADAEKVSGPVWATQDDPRITKSGKFIRKTRLDELPQLFNVLAGHMSLVGPRPERQHFVDDLTKKIPYFKQRHIVKPGLTGWAQINYRYGSTFEDAVQKLQFDLFYIKNQSLLFDLSILFNTVKIVILRKGT